MALAIYIMMAAGYGYSVWLLWDQGRSGLGELRSSQVIRAGHPIQIDPRPMISRAQTTSGALTIESRGR